MASNYDEDRMTWLLARDPYLVLADAKTALANHKPMTDGDCLAWHLCDGAQKFLMQEEADRG